MVGVLILQGLTWFVSDNYIPSAVCVGRFVCSLPAGVWNHGCHHDVWWIGQSHGKSGWNNQSSVWYFHWNCNFIWGSISRICVLTDDRLCWTFLDFLVADNIWTSFQYNLTPFPQVVILHIAEIIYSSLFIDTTCSKKNYQNWNYLLSYQ